MIKHLLSLTISFSALTAALLAQGARIETFQDLNIRDQLSQPSEMKQEATVGKVTPLYSEETADIGPQYILKPKFERQWFEASVDTQFYYTDNVFLEENLPINDPTDTSITVVTAQFAVAPTPGWKVGEGTLSPRVGFRNQSYFYSLADSSTEKRLNDLDFTGQTIFTDLFYQFGGTWQARAGFDATRLFSHSGNELEFYKELLPRWGMDKIFEVTPVSAFVLSYDGNYHLTETKSAIPIFNQILASDRNDRSDQSVTVSFVQQIVPNFVVRPYYRFQYTGYAKEDPISRVDRSDKLNTVGVILSYSFNKWSSVRLFCSYDMKDSNDPLVSDYDKFDGGIGATLNIRF
ncbi:hypothetical protein QPK87_07765 [Kamptonema cortianum]|nr:hypothetical protein [Oscillatoria laete-virens]MDK3156472.1 hypothetical protein [Kamptonema cortianum]MDL5053845.1 hypothetical protein [Oscillatoria laete-virens NRMC-F 0139]